MLQSDCSFTSHPVLARIHDLIRTKTSYTAVSGSSTSLLWTSIKPLKYLTVLTLSSLVAGSSQTKMVEGCCWKAETVHMWLTPSSMALWRANALWAPVIRIITLRNTQTSEEGCRVFFGFAANTTVQEHLQKRMNMQLRLFSLSRASSMKKRKRPPFPNLKKEEIDCMIFGVGFTSFSTCTQKVIHNLQSSTDQASIFHTQLSCKLL